MVKLMNKAGFIKELNKQLKYSENECTIINDILEDNFIFSKKNKDKIVSDFINKLGIEEDEANHIYEISMSIITNEIKYKIKHPFRNKKDSRIS